MIASDLKRDAAKALAILRSAINMRDCFVFGGLGLIWYGVSLVSPPAAWVVVGLFTFWLGVR